MYNVILVPVDLGHKGRIAAMMDIAKHLSAENARIILVNVVEDVPSYVASQLPAGMIENTMQNAADDLKSIAKEYNIKPELEVRSGHAANAILEVADEKGADAIVIASHKPGWEDILIGSTAARVVRHAKCAVHVLR